MTVVESHVRGRSDLLLSVTDAAEILGVGRTLAYRLAHEYEVTGGTQGLPVIRLGSACLRVPRWALLELARTGRVVTLATIETSDGD